MAYTNITPLFIELILERAAEETAKGRICQQIVEYIDEHGDLAFGKGLSTLAARSNGRRQDLLDAAGNRKGKRFGSKADLDQHELAEFQSLPFWIVYADLLQELFNGVAWRVRRHVNELEQQERSSIIAAEASGEFDPLAPPVDLTVSSTVGERTDRITAEFEALQEAFSPLHAQWIARCGNMDDLPTGLFCFVNYVYVPKLTTDGEVVLRDDGKPQNERVITHQSNTWSEIAVLLEDNLDRLNAENREADRKEIAAMEDYDPMAS